jgi:hypothetical protein
MEVDFSKHFTFRSGKVARLVKVMPGGFLVADGKTNAKFVDKEGRCPVSNRTMVQNDWDKFRATVAQTPTREFHENETVYIITNGASPSVEEGVFLEKEKHMLKVYTNSGQRKVVGAQIIKEDELGTWLDRFIDSWPIAFWDAWFKVIEERNKNGKSSSAIKKAATVMAAKTLLRKKS